MSNFQYLDKRDYRGVLLRYSAHELAFDVSSNALDLIRVNEIYSILVRGIPKKYVDLYYHKMIYEAFLPMAHQLVIYNYDKEHNQKKSSMVICAKGFPSKSLLDLIWPESGVNISFENEILFLKEKFKHLAKRIQRLICTFLYSNEVNAIIEKSNSETSIIAVNYQEGFDTSKRSDFFWVKDSGIDLNKVAVYYENKNLMKKFDGEKIASKFFEINGIKQLQLWKCNLSKKYNNFDSLLSDVKSINCSNDIDEWLKKTAKNLCDKSSYWLNFFNNHEMKIHLDATYGGLETIYKQIALNNMGCLSLGKVRSYELDIKGGFDDFYINDIFFTWGSNSAKRLKTKNAYIKNIIVSGYPYSSKSFFQKKGKAEKKSVAKLKNTVFNLLLLDSNHGRNTGPYQFIPTDVMISFYQSVLDWVKEDDSVGLVIKPKKSQFLNEIPNIIDQIYELEQTSSRVFLVKDSFQKMPITYLDGINIVIGTSAFFPTALIECALHGARAVFYDYPNLRYHESDFYTWAENRVVFSDLNEMILALKSYKKDPSLNPLLGDWSDHLDDFDPFRDGLGGVRIGIYIRWLQEGFEKGLGREEVIARANGLYAEAWGKEKVYLSETNIQQDYPATA